MCPSYSCCHRRRAGALSTPFYYLARLRLAAGTAELLPNELPALADREAALRTRLQHAVLRLLVPAGRIRPRLEQLLTALLERTCCRQALRRLVPLAEALGPLALLGWSAEATTIVQSVHGEKYWHSLGDA